MSFEPKSPGNFDFKSPVNPAAEAQLAQKKQEIENQQQTNSQDDTYKAVQDAVAAGSQAVQGMVLASKQKQKDSFVKTLADNLSTSGALSPNPTTGQSSMINGPVPTASFDPRQSDAMRAAIQLNPDKAATDYLAQQIPKTPAPLTTDKLLATAIQQGNQPMINAITKAKTKPVVGGTGRGGTIKTIDRLMPDGTTHIIRLDSDSKETDLGLKGSATTNVSSAQARGSADFAATLIPHVAEMRDLIKEADAQGFIGPTAGRVYGQFLAGKIGSTGNPDADHVLGRLRAFDSLLKSGTLKAHFGSRGGQQMYEKFDSILNTGKMSAAELNGALDSIQSFMEGYVKAGRPGGAQDSAPALKATHRWNPATGQVEAL